MRENIENIIIAIVAILIIGWLWLSAISYGAFL
jgi:hypothetical protein